MVRVGLIAEDQDDVDVVSSLLRKLRPRKSFRLRQFLGHGCGKIRSKCSAWASQLRVRGCNILIIVHDLDRRSLEELYNGLRDSLEPCPFDKYAIIIPIEEIEAWLLADLDAVRAAMNIRKAIPSVTNPDT